MEGLGPQASHKIPRPEGDRGLGYEKPQYFRSGHFIKFLP